MSFDDENGENGVSAHQALPIGHEANRALCTILADHVLGLQAAVISLRSIHREIWQDTTPLPERRVQQLGHWFRERSAAEQATADAIHDHLLARGQHGHR
jgi:hypothetical protein